LGAFSSPDPGGAATADPKNPTSWNRYAYAYGDPINLVDPGGTAPCDASGDPNATNPCPALAAGGDGGYGLGDLGCNLDGMPISCSQIHSGATVPVPPGVQTVMEGMNLAISALSNFTCADLFGMGSISPITLLSEVQLIFQADTADPDLDAQTFLPDMAGNPTPGGTQS